MCSRFNLTAPPEAVRAKFGYRNEMAFPPRHDIAPTQPVAIVRRGAAGEREMTLVRWGLIPPWVKDPGTFATLIIARAETALDKPSFKAAMRHRRCLVPATGYYEWTGKAGSRVPHHVRPRQGGILAMAGLWEHWMGSDGSEIETMAILTVPANATVAAIHERMPALISPAHLSGWLDVRAVRDDEAAQLLAPASADLLEIKAAGPTLGQSRPSI